MRRNGSLWVLCFFITLGILTGCSKQNDRKIKLSNRANSEANVQSVSSMVQFAPEEQHSIAILPFINKTQNKNLNWLRRGLADMLATELSQSIYIDVIALSRIYEILGEMGKKPDNLKDLDLTLTVAKKARVKTIITGTFVQDKMNFKIHVTLWNVETGQILTEENVQGKSLEQIFSIVNKLSEILRDYFQGEIKVSPAQKPLREMTQSVEAFRCYSTALEQLDKFAYSQADSCLRRAIELDSTFAAAYLRLAEIKFRINDVQGADLVLKQAQRHAERLSKPDQIWLRLYEARLKGDISGLLAALEDFLRFEPNDLQTRLQLANLLHMQLGKYDRALEEYELILEIDPDQKIVYNNLGYLYAKRGDFKTALKYIDQYINLAPDEPNPYDSKGELLMMAGRMQEAVKLLKIALAKRPDFYHSAMRLSLAYSELGDLQQALKYSDLWIKNAPSALIKAEAYLNKAALLWRFGKVKEAKKSLIRAQNAYPNFVQIALVGGEMYKAIGDTAAAKQLYFSYFDRFKNLISSKNLEYNEIYKILRFCMEADLPAEQLIPILVKLIDSEKRPLQKHFFATHLAILYMRVGNFEKARQYYTDLGQEFIDLLIQFPNPGWSVSWKYSVEAIQLAPLQDKEDFTFVNNLMEAARKAGRQDLQIIAQFFYAQYYAKYERKNALAKVYQKLGTPLENVWLVIGPFANRSGFDHVFPPERSIKLDTSYQSAERNLRWQHIIDGAYEGYVDLRSSLQPSSWAVGYGVLYVNSPDRRKVQLRVASDEACKMWLNDKLVWQAYRTGEVPLDHDIVAVVLHPGDNKILIKVTNSIEDWGFYFRVTDEQGAGFSDIKFRSADRVKGDMAYR